MALIVFKHALAQRLIGGFLIALQQGGIDLHAAGINGLLVFVIHGLTHHFCNIVCVHVHAILLRFAYHQFLRNCVSVLRVVDVFQLVHATQHVELAQPGAIKIDHRVVA